MWWVLLVMLVVGVALLAWSVLFCLAPEGRGMEWALRLGGAGVLLAGFAAIMGVSKLLWVMGSALARALR